MLDIQRIRTQPQAVAEALAKRGITVDFTAFLEQEAAYRLLLGEVQEKKAVRNRMSAEVGRMKAAGQDASQSFEDMRRLGEEIKAADAQIAVLDTEMQTFLAGLPNTPDPDVQAGGKEENRVIGEWGTKPNFAFAPKNHVDLATDLKLIDYERGAKLSGNGYWIYTGQGALLEWALIQFFIQTHVRDGWQMILPPHMLGAQAGFTAGQFPKFDDEVYWVNQPGHTPDGHFMLPTAETALVNLHRDEILDQASLPLKYVAFSPCYRREAGSYRQDERGMIRGHQFHKVELVQYTTPEQSAPAFEEMVGRAAGLVQALGLHHRVVQLAAGDCSHSMARTVDIEIWIPSMNGYKEVSSASNANDYQARRGNMRYRQGTEKPIHLHTLNASGLATSRVFPAILEQYQQADGSVRVPKVLQPFVGVDVLR